MQTGSARTQPRGLVALLLVFTTPCHAWSTYSQILGDPSSSVDEVKQLGGTLHRLWDYPTQEGWGPTADEPLYANFSTLLRSPGLAGAITYAWDPQMCAVLDPLFGIDLWGFEFSSCGDIAAAVRMAFDSWSANHPRLKFIDVTNNCLANAVAGHPNFTDLSDTKPCPLATVWLTTTRASAREDAAAVMTAEYEFNTQYRFTNGRYATRGVFQVTRATIGFKQDNLCWYLDATFCDPINRWKRDIGAESVLLLGRCFIFVLWAIVIADILWIAVDACKKHQSLRVKEGRTFKPPVNLRMLERQLAEATFPGLQRRAQAALRRGLVTHKREEAKWTARLITSVDEAEEFALLVDRLARVDWGPWILRLFLLIAPIIFYRMIFDPCFSCYDFQAAATHEIGHVLGLAHPDQASPDQLNLMVQRSPGEELAIERTAQAVSAALSGGARSRTSSDDAATTAQMEASCGGMASCLASAVVDCWDPWARVVVRPNQSAVIAPVAPSIMQAFSFNNPSKCIFQDDLDAINTLYPACDAALNIPVCNTPTTYLGVVRLLAYVGLPLLITLLLMVFCNRLLIQLHQSGRQRSLAQLSQAVNDPNVQMTAPDGSKLSHMEERAILVEAHIQSLAGARRQQLERGRHHGSPEVLALDEQIRKCTERVNLLRDADANGEILEEEETAESDSDLLQSLLVPMRGLAKEAKQQGLALIAAARYKIGVGRQSRVAPSFFEEDADDGEEDMKGDDEGATALDDEEAGDAHYADEVPEDPPEDPPLAPDEVVAPLVSTALLPQRSYVTFNIGPDAKIRASVQVSAAEQPQWMTSLLAEPAPVGDSTSVQLGAASDEEVASAVAALPEDQVQRLRAALDDQSAAEVPMWSEPAPAPVPVLAADPPAQASSPAPAPASAPAPAPAFGFAPASAPAPAPVPAAPVTHSVVTEL